jgi:hypothetical protein
VAQSVATGETKTDAHSKKLKNYFLKIVDKFLKIVDNYSRAENTIIIRDTENGF